MARRNGEEREIRDRMEMFDEDYITARRTVRRDRLEETCLDIYDNFPDSKRIPDEGSWIQIILPPHCEITAEPLSIWYALPVFKEKTWDYMEGERSNRYKIKVLTPVGEFMLFPSEYNVVTPETVMEYMNMLEAANDPNTDHISIHWLDPRNELFDADRLLYIMSRGIRRADAYKMLMGDVRSPHVCYFTFHEEYQRMFAGLGVNSLRARETVEKHIDFVNMEKAAGRWYNMAYREQQIAQQKEADAASELEEKEARASARQAKRRRLNLSRLGQLEVFNNG